MDRDEGRQMTVSVEGHSITLSDDIVKKYYDTFGRILFYGDYEENFLAVRLPGIIDGEIKFAETYENCSNDKELSDIIERAFNVRIEEYNRMLIDPKYNEGM